MKWFRIPLLMSIGVHNSKKATPIIETVPDSEDEDEPMEEDDSSVEATPPPSVRSLHR